MKIARAIEGGLTGASTLGLLQKTLHKMDGRSLQPLLHRGNKVRQWKKAGKKGKLSAKLLIEMAGELLSGAAYYGLGTLGKRKNAVLSGALLGAGAGLGVALLKDESQFNEKALVQGSEDQTTALKQKLLTVALYTTGGMLAGYAVKQLKGKNKKAKKRK